MVLIPNVDRYLQHLASTRLQHLERIRMFTTRAFGRISKQTSKNSAAFSRSLSLLNFAGLEASAIQSFADGLSCVSFLAITSVVQNCAIIRPLTLPNPALLPFHSPQPPSQLVPAFSL